MQNTLICFEMLLMAIAGGIAYTYKNYELEKKSYGTCSSVIDDTINTFKNDFKLIKPKTFGFKNQQFEEI